MSVCCKLMAYLLTSGNGGFHSLYKQGKCCLYFSFVYKCREKTETTIEKQGYLRTFELQLSPGDLNHYYVGTEKVIHILCSVLFVQ